MNELHLFAGAGGGILGGMLLGHTTVCAVEIEPYCREVLLQRQRDGVLPKFPIWDDVTTFDGTPWRGKVDVVCGGFPCTDISWAWAGKGLHGTKSGLWWQMYRIIKEIQPRYVFVENVKNIRKRGLKQVVDSMHEFGYTTETIDISARDVGSPHLRERTWIMCKRSWEPIVFASDCYICEMCEEPICPNCKIHYSECNCPGPHSEDDGWEIREENWGIVAYNNSTRLQEQRRSGSISKEYTSIKCIDWWAIEPELDRVAHGMANRVYRLKAVGNGQVPAVAALAWQILKGE